MNGERLTFTKKIKGKTLNHYYIAKNKKEKEELVKNMSDKGFELTCISPVKIL